MLSTKSSQKLGSFFHKIFMNAGEQVTPKVVQEFLKRVAPFGVPSQAMQLPMAWQRSAPV
jgi:hypothetical protein